MGKGKEGKVKCGLRESASDEYRKSSLFTARSICCEGFEERHDGKQVTHGVLSGRMLAAPAKW